MKKAKWKVKNQTLCRPNRAAVIPPESPEGGLELEQATNDPLKPKDCKNRVLRGGSIGELWRMPSRGHWPSLSGCRFLNRAINRLGLIF
jgi:hypothetical protein